MPPRGREAQLRARVAELEERVAGLELELARSEKVRRVLIDRVERSIGEQEGSYALFERNIVLQKYVEERTADLAALNETLRAEIVHRQAIEHELQLSRDAALSSQREAVQATKAKSEFLANMSHEIRTPMNAIIGMVQLTLRTSLDVKQRHYVQNILDSAQSLLGILNDILDLSKVEAGRMEIESIDFELSTVLTKLGNLVAIRAEQKGIELLWAVDADVPERLVGDPLRLGQVLLNLCNNAIKFTERGEVKVRIEQDLRTAHGATLRFSVTDTGIGIEPEQCSRLFQMFSQADASTTRRFGGTGLGLAICKALVEMMGGEIGVESTPGQGSCFHFWLPFARPMGDAESLQYRVRLPGRHRVLVVSANATGRELLADLVRSCGVGCEAVGSVDTMFAQLASAATEGTPYDVLFVDHRAPRQDGLELVRALRHDPGPGPLPAVCIVTGHGQEDVRLRAQEMGIDGFLTRPFNRSTVYDALVVALGGEPSVPSEQVAAERDARLARARAFLSNFTVLLAEDNAVNTQIACAFLAELGAEVVTARDGDEAVALVKSRPDISLVLMDIQMPKRDGLEATRIIRSDPAFARLPILAMTAHAMTSDAVKSREAGMDGHLVKPVDPEHLREELVTLLSQRYPNLWSSTEDVVADGGGAFREAAVDHAVPAFTLPSLPGLDAERGALFAEGRENYRKMLLAFVGDGRRHERALSVGLREGDHRALQRTAHSLRGAAGYLCAGGLVERAAEVEDGFRHGQSSEALERVPLLQEELHKLLRGLEEWNGGDPHPRVTNCVLDGETAERADEILERMEPLVADGDAAADDLLAELGSFLAGTPVEPLLARLEHDITCIEFAAAAETLAALRAALRGAG